MKPTLKKPISLENQVSLRNLGSFKILVSLQFFLLLALSIHYVSTVGHLERISHLLTKLNDSSKIVEIDNSEHYRNKSSPSTTSQLTVEKSPLIESQFNKDELEQIKHLLEHVISSLPAKQHSDLSLEKPVESEDYFKLNDLVSNYILQGDISEQAFIALSQEMLAIHPKQRQQLMMRLAKELNQQ